ncbi:MAG TPA: Hpt domain-containing protein [Methylotenera sp.]|nr:Hpt domain-containing protein [Methylotenera sp.]HPV45563.1 Hpt domain-containing protein [Methylotenera sp.]
MAENFDSGPLSWVKDQINQLLDSVLENVNSVRGNVHDTSSMRFSQTSLYQASGALDMVGLEGCKRFCSELEKLAGKLEKKTINATPEIIDAFSKAVRTLQSYLQELLNGSPDIPLRLYSALSPIVAAQGETLEESELFFPDTTNSAPKDNPSRQLTEAEYAGFIVEQRMTYQKSLLNWLQTRQIGALEAMTAAVSNVSQAQQKTSNKTLWWAASAFTESLEQKEIAENQGAKRLCRKLDQELRLFADGVSKPHSNLLRDILYYVAISDVDKANVRKVKEVFELDQLIDKKTSVDFAGTGVDADETARVQQLIDELDQLRELWDEVSGTIDFTKVDVNAGRTQVPLDNVLITRFSDVLAASCTIAQNLRHTGLADVYSALQQASNTLRDDASKVNHAALIEVAAALNLIEDSLKNYQYMDSDKIHNLRSEVQRLESISSGEVYGKLEADRAEALDRDTVKTVVAHVKESLKTIEQALDSYFRHPAEKAPLMLTLQPLKQVFAVFDMLGMPTPADIVNACDSLVRHFQQADYVTNQAHFELVAESLSMIGLYADELPKTRPESEQALEGALQRLNNTLAEAGLEKTESEAQIKAVSAVLADVTVMETVESLAAKEAEQAVSPAIADGAGVVDRAFDSELLDIYLTEAEEVLAHIAQNCQALRVNATDREALVEVRRSFHTLKGSGRTVGLNALGEIAGKVEFFLNGVLDKKSMLNPQQIVSIEQIAAAYAGWMADLRANGQVNVNQEAWFTRIVLLSSEGEKPSAKPAKKPDAQVLIGGTRKLSRALYDIFINESMQNITLLEQEAAKLAADSSLQPSAGTRRAVHTLASNALATGFKPMGELGRALENWLDAVSATWSPRYLELYTNTVKSLANMWQKISELRNPRSAHALIKVLNLAAQQTAQNKEPSVELVEIPQQEETVAMIAAETAEAPLVQEIMEETNPEQVADIDVKLVTESMPYQAPGAHDATPVNQELLTMFIEEAREILPEIGAELRAWRTSPKQTDHPDALQRALHTLKGSARMASQSTLGDAVHELEDHVMRSLKRRNEVIDFEGMFVELDKIGSHFEAILSHIPSQAIDQGQEKATVPAGRATDRKAQFLRMRADTLDRLINDAGEISIIRSRLDRELANFKQSSNDLTESVTRLRTYLRELEIEAETQLQSRMNVLQETHETFDPLEFDRFTRLQELTRMIAESVNDVATIQHGLLSNLDQSEAALQQQSRMNRDLQQSLLSARMLPFRQITERLQRIVRQTARELKKPVDLEIDGEATEIDRSVLDKLGAPLEHLLRNAVAHGIESPSERLKSGKAETGSIKLRVRQENDEISIIVSDDGAGINLQRVRERAIKNRMLDANAEVGEQALMSLIFEPGFSTAERVSQIAGRGVGLDVVRNDVSGLGGRVDLNSEAGKGTTFNVHLPVRLSVAHVLAVRSGHEIYALPVAMIEQAQKIKRLDLINAYKAGEIKWADKQYPLHYLSKLLDHQEHQPEDHAYISVLLLRSGSYSIALHVDEVIGNQEAVMKPIGAQLARVPGIVGATVAGDGSIVLIINPVQLANREDLAVGSVVVKTAKAKAPKMIAKQRILVVDDSLTMRKVLSRLLEREGFEVLVAKDGMDAMQLLQEITPDAILTDIEMPRMDGFGLARNIRDDARTTNTPLIMISSRTADKHQNLAREIGVDAFFGKPVQDDDLIGKINDLLASRRVLH